MVVRTVTSAFHHHNLNSLFRVLGFPVSSVLDKLPSRGSQVTSKARLGHQNLFHNLRFWSGKCKCNHNVACRAEFYCDHLFRISLSRCVLSHHITINKWGTEVPPFAAAAFHLVRACYMVAGHSRGCAVLQGGVLGSSLWERWSLPGHFGHSSPLKPSVLDFSDSFDIKTTLNQPIRRYGSHLLLCFNYVTQRLKTSYESYPATDQCPELKFHVTIFGDHDKGQSLGTRSDTMKTPQRIALAKWGRVLSELFWSFNSKPLLRLRCTVSLYSRDGFH